jgi:hypothetical protein
MNATAELRKIPKKLPTMAGSMVHIRASARACACVCVCVCPTIIVQYHHTIPGNFRLPIVDVN